MNQETISPGKIMEISGGYWQTCALHTGIKLDLFTLIGDAACTGREVAEKSGTDTRGLTMLLDALTAMKLLTKTDDRFSNTEVARNFLSKDSRSYLGHIIQHHQQLMASWNRLEESVKSGGPIRDRASRTDDSWRENFLMGMFNIAMQQAPKIVEKLDLSGRKKLLDLGGGPGTYAIHFCKANPQLKAVVYDLPTTRPFAEKTIERFGLSGRIGFEDVDFIEQGIQGTFDAAWLSHILHGERYEDCNRIIQKTISAMEPGGIIIIHEFILNNSMDGPLFPALFSLNMLLGTDGGQAYSEQQISEMLSSAGAHDIKRIPIESPNDSGILVGTVKN